MKCRCGSNHHYRGFLRLGVRRERVRPLPIGEDNLLMASDALESLGQQVVQGNNVYVSVPRPDQIGDTDLGHAGPLEGLDVCRR